jgi:hypothetical protein
MTDQALDAVESDPLERMIGILDEEEGDPTGDEPAPEEPEDEEEATTEETEEEAPKAEELETIVHNGEEKQLTKAELKELAQQGFDYTQKTQQLAEQRRYVEQQAQYVRQQAQFQAQFTDQIAQVKAVEGQLAQWKQVNWTELAQTDPMQYLSLHHQYTEAKEAHQTQIQQHSQLQQQAQQTAAEQQAQRLQREAQAMRQAIPEWKDQARANAEMTELKQFLAHAGFGEQEIASVADHRQVTLARKAMLYDKLVAQGKQKVATAPPPTAKPGSTAKPNTDGKKIREALKTTGKGEYAAKLIERML